MEDRKPSARPPLAVSVVIGTVNRLPSLRRALESLRRQTHQPVEAVVVVGPSTDGTDAYVAALTDVKRCRVDRLNLAHACNAGVRAAAGDIVAFLDDDAVANPRWLEELVRVYGEEGPDCAGVGGAVVNEHIRSRVVQFRYGLVHERGDIDDVRIEPGTANDPDGVWFNRLMGANMSFRRSALVAVGGFDEAFPFMHDETDLGVTLIRAGYRIVHHGRAFVHHFPVAGPMRRNDYELDWFDMLRGGTCFTLKHCGQGFGTATRAALSRYTRTLRQFTRWLTKREIGPVAWLRFSVAATRGLLAGLRQGWVRRRSPRPPFLLPEDSPPPFLSLTPAAPEVRSGPARQVRGRGLRVALVCGYFGSGPGGIATYTQHLAEALASLGHAPVVLRAGWEPCRIRPQGYEVVDIPPGRIQATSIQSALYETLYELAAERPFDVVEAPLWPGEAAAVGMGTLCPLIVRLETPWEVVRRLSGLPFDAVSRTTIAAERLQLSYAAGAIAISRAIWQTIETEYELKLPTHARQATVIPLGIPGAAGLELKEVRAVDAGGPRFLYVGRLEARKGTLELGEAFAQVARVLPRATLWVVGADNSANDGFHRQTGVTYVERLTALWGPEVASRVQCFGSVSEAAKNYLYWRCEVLVAPSRYESFGLIFLEAMRFGKPVIGTDVGGIPEIVRHGGTGLLVPVQAPDRLAEAMSLLGGDARLRQEFGDAGRDRFEEEFNLYRCALRTEQFYRSVLESWDGRPVPDPLPEPYAIGRLYARAA